jgi:signal transduction histidine kinase
MPARFPFQKYSLRSRLFTLGGATFLLCAGVILLFYPLLNITLEGLMDRTIRSMGEAKEVEATTLSRLLVLEFSQLNELLLVTPGEDSDLDQRIKNLIWQKVTFNENIEGLELIQAGADAQDRHLTYMFYRREAPELKPMPGPQKLMKKFSGLEKELIDAINDRQRVDRARLDSVNRGPKKEGEMLLRYFPVHVLMPDEGAIYWGVAKVGIETHSLANLLLLQNQEQQRIRRTIWVEIILSLSIAGLLALGLLSLWARRLTEPLRELGAVTRDLAAVRPRDFSLWLQNLERVDTQDQSEPGDIKNSLMRLGAAIPRLGQRLLDAEREASVGKVAARIVPGCRRWLDRLKALDAAGPPSQAADAARERERLLANLTTSLQDLYRFGGAGETAWQAVDLHPAIMSAWRLATLGAPEGTRFIQNVEPLQPVWGNPFDLEHALLALVEFVGSVAEPKGELALRAVTRPGGGVAITFEVSGPPSSLEQCQTLLTPFQAAADIQGRLGPALVAAVAEQHGGSLDIAPRAAGGLILTLELPGAPDSHEAFDPYI